MNVMPTAHIADSQPLLRQALATLLTKAGFTVVGESSCAIEMETAVSQQQPDLLITDLPDLAGNGWGSLSHLQQNTPQTKLIVLTTRHDPTCLARAISAGAVAFLDKQAAPQYLIDAIRLALDGPYLFEPQQLQAALAWKSKPLSARQNGRLANLTPAEQTVLHLLGRGDCNQTMATRLDISINTVKTHLRHIFKKIGVTDRTQAALWAVHNGLTRWDEEI